MRGMKRGALTACACVVTLAWASYADAEASKPFAGVTLVKRPGSALVIADLCAPGVSVRATKYAERRRTPQSWGTLVDAEVAINADFFDFPAATLTDGRARGAGEDWPADKQNIGLQTRGEDRHYWQFGPVLGTDPIEPMSVPPAPPTAASEIVGGHNVLIRDGKNLGPNYDGDGVLRTAARRTAIGTNKERSLLYMFTTGNASTGAQLTAALLSHAAEGGAPDIDFASNLDGGGSTQMYVKGQGQIVTSGRLVANHLGVMAKGSGASPMCPGKRPIGYLDVADCERVAGWALDPDEPEKQLDVLLSYDGFYPDPKTRIVEARADVERPDLEKPFGSTRHGFVSHPPFALFDGEPHPVWAVAKDSAGGRPAVLGESPRTFTCRAAPPRSVKRHVANPEVYGAWRFDGFVDQLALEAAAITKLADGPQIAEPPVLARIDGGDGFYLIEGARRRRIVDETSLRAWRFDPTEALPKTRGELLALESGPPLRARPMLAKAAAAPEVYLLDALDSEADDADPLLGPAGGAPPDGDPGRSPGSRGGAPDAVDEGCAAGGRSGAPSPLWLLAFVALAVVRAARSRRPPSDVVDGRRSK
jgi:hypothetical protein